MCTRWILLHQCIALNSRCAKKKRAFEITPQSRCVQNVVWALSLPRKPIHPIMLHVISKRQLLIMKRSVPPTHVKQGYNSKRPVCQKMLNYPFNLNIPESVFSYRSQVSSKAFPRYEVLAQRACGHFSSSLNMFMLTKCENLLHSSEVAVCVALRTNHKTEAACFNMLLLSVGFFEVKYCSLSFSY